VACVAVAGEGDEGVHVAIVGREELEGFAGRPGEEGEVE
jgi:hypothetical protein